MHTAKAARGQGIGRAIVDHLLAVAATRGTHRVSLETGSMEAFAPARSLYASAGFTPSGPFGRLRTEPEQHVHDPAAGRWRVRATAMIGLN
jgi:putative acetyltransferase